MIKCTIEKKEKKEEYKKRDENTKEKEKVRWKMEEIRSNGR